MTNGKKVIGLAMLIAIPILILLFLENFGQQHYTVPTDPAEAEGLSAEVPAGSLGQPFQLPTSLLDNQGRAITSNLLEARETIIFPLRTVGSDTAQLVLEQLTRVQGVFEQQEGVQILVIVPSSDPNTLSQLSRRYRSQAERWRFLASTTEDNPFTDTLPQGISSSTIILVDRDQRIRGYYDGAQEDEIDRLIVETRILRFGVE